MKRRGFALLLTVLLLALLCACGSSGGNAAPAGGAETTEAEYGGDNGAFAPEEPSAGEAMEDSKGSGRLENAKMVYTANMEVETTDFETCASDLEKLVDELGGYFEYAAVNSYGTGYRSGSYTVRVPAEQFDAFCRRVGELCHVTYQDQSQDNISEAYYDTEIRLTTQRTKLERLQTLLAKAEKMEDIIALESAISDTELEIEQLTGTLRSYDSLVDFSTVYVSLREVYKLSNTEEPSTGFAGRLGTAFSSGWRSFVSGLETLAVSLAHGWVWVLLLAAAAAAVFRILKRRGRTRRSSPPEKKDQ